MKRAFFGLFAMFIFGYGLISFFADFIEIVSADEGMYCYMPYGQPVIAEHYVDSTLVTIHWLDQERGDVAWSEWVVDEEQSLSTCDIWAKRPMQPLGDPDMDALGHELLHCLIGDFHK